MSVHDVEQNHVVHFVDVGRQKRARGRDTRIVDEHRDTGVGAQQRFDPAEIRFVVEIRRDDFDRPAGFVCETLPGRRGAHGWTLS